MTKFDIFVGDLIFAFLLLIYAITVGQIPILFEIFQKAEKSTEYSDDLQSGASYFNSLGMSNHALISAMTDDTQPASNGDFKCPSLTNSTNDLLPPT